MRTTAACRTGFVESKRPTQQIREETYSIQPRGVLWFLFLTLSFPRRLAGGSGGCFLSPSVFFAQVVVKIGTAKPVVVNKTRFFIHKPPDVEKKYSLSGIMR